MDWILRIVIGTALCVALDLRHVQSGTTFYASPFALGVAGWTPVLFAAASAAALGGTRGLRAALGVPPVPWDARRVLADGVTFVAVYGCTSFLGAAPIALAATLSVWWLVRVAVDTPRWVILSCLLTAAAGSATEIGLSSAGLFGYHHPDVLGIPWWLPAIYLHAAVFGAGLEAGIPAPRVR